MSPPSRLHSGLLALRPVAHRVIREGPDPVGCRGETARVPVDREAAGIVDGAEDDFHLVRMMDCRCAAYF